MLIILDLIWELLQALLELLEEFQEEPQLEDLEIPEMDSLGIPAQQDPGEFFQNMNNLLEQEIKRLSEENQKLDQRIHNATAEQEDIEESAALEEGLMAAVKELSTEAEMVESAEPEKEEDILDKAEKRFTELESLAAEIGAVEGKSAVLTQKTQEMPNQEMLENRNILKTNTKKIHFDTEVQDLAEADRIAEREINREESPIEKLTDDQKSIFSYFVPVKGMENQLCKVLTGLIHHLQKDDKASRGNLIIQGGQGCGKTVLVTSLIKVLQKETGKPNGKIGKIQAGALNQKDIQLMLQKVAGGCLIIEKAGDLSKEAAVTLSLLLEQDSSGVLVILEDTSKGIKKALSQDGTFAKKFTEKITVPIFTNDELVSFAKAYSEELGYEIEEMAVLALYNRISNIQRIDQATTLTEVKEIVDEAIDREAHGGMKLAFSILTAKRYSDNDRIILREKDFQ